MSLCVCCAVLYVSSCTRRWPRFGFHWWMVKMTPRLLCGRTTKPSPRGPCAPYGLSSGSGTRYVRFSVDICRLLKQEDPRLGTRDSPVILACLLLGLRYGWCILLEWKCQTEFYPDERFMSFCKEGTVPYFVRLNLRFWCFVESVVRHTCSPSRKLPALTSEVGTRRVLVLSVVTHHMVSYGITYRERSRRKSVAGAPGDQPVHEEHPGAEQRGRGKRPASAKVSNYQPPSSYSMLPCTIFQLSSEIREPPTSTGVGKKEKGCRLIHDLTFLFVGVDVDVGVDIDVAYRSV